MASHKSNNPLNEDFWVDAEYSGSQPHQFRAADALTAAYGANGVCHLIERSLSERNLSEYTDHEYAGLKNTLLEDMLCAQRILLKVISNNLEIVCEHSKPKTE
ncbi:hypothetical protein A7981_06550 [Methylovorus sp. MM2]|uniref:hypothetical protein n=1 Tax=Methylovorus sp. MM2 TaxID=1848038 RepID=UPI0007DE6CA7|nr:hypothetical protein [Methylovorus sp. MM2]OAM53076.1 hypothetical protein A7981_06550 [Methylovorus sp. MM2]